MESQHITRRGFISTSTAAGVGLLAMPSLGSMIIDTRLRVLSIGVIGTIGGADRNNVHQHAEADIVGLCDVDSNALAKASEDHPDAFTCTDYREAFDRYGDMLRRRHRRHPCSTRTVPS